MATISTIMPAGGGDYTTLAAWWDWADGESTADQWAECYSGGDLGPVTLSNMTATPDANNYPRVYVADGHGHEGDKTAGAYIDAGIVNQAIETIDVPYVRFEGLRVTNTYQFGNGIGVSFNAPNGYADGLLIHDCYGTGLNHYLGVSSDIVIRNCLLIDNAESISQDDIGIYASGNGITINAEISNCTSTNKIVCNDFFNSVAGTVTQRNNYAGSLSFTTFSGWSHDVAYCATADASADDWGGSGNLVDQTATNLFTDPDNNDFTLKAGSALIDAGADLSGSFTDDILGNTRPGGSDFDIGAFEYFAPAEINVLDGETPVADGETTPINFGSVVLDGSGVQKTFTVENLGDLTLTITSVTHPAGYNIDGTSELLGNEATIAGGESKTLIINQQTGEAGTFSGDITINSDDSDEAAFNFAVTGEVTEPVESILIIYPPNVPRSLSRLASPDRRPCRYGEIKSGLKSLNVFFRVR